MTPATKYVPLHIPGTNKGPIPPIGNLTSYG
jgi:hypothetical protein